MKTIFTIKGYFNYGNRLQLFALASVIARFDKDILVYEPKNIKNKLKEFMKYTIPFRMKDRKERKIKYFSKKYIPKVTHSKNYGCAIVGSDQVWNPEWFNGQLYLLNIPNGVENISYAASIGVENLTDGQKKIFKEALKNYRAISVREKSAKELLQPLTEKKIEVVLDPTLLLDKAEYEKLEKRPKNIAEGEKYILCYMLGDHDHQLAIERFAKKNNYRLIVFSDKEGSSYGVEEFLYLIDHAELICTDSFHACVFSFIYDRPFIAFKRTGEADYMYSRLRNFMDIFNLEKHEYDGFDINKEKLECDYTKGKKILAKEREKSLRFLKEALGKKR